MTNKERLISLLGFQPDKNSADGILLEKDIEGEDEFDPIYDPTIVVKLRLCAIELMELLLTTPDQTNDVGMVIKYDRVSLLKRLDRMKEEAGIVSESPKIRNKSFMW